MLSFGQLTCKGEVVCPVVLVLLFPIRRSILFSAVIIADEDYQFYLEWLKEYADKADCSIHSYVLMTNHVYLLVSAEKADAIGALTITLVVISIMKKKLFFDLGKRVCIT